MESHSPVRGPGELKALRKHVASATVTYLGSAPSGALTSSAVWQIRRLTTNVGGDLTLEWADGNVEFDNIWDNRASLSYS